MIIKVKDLHSAACKNIRSMANYKPYEKESTRNDIKMKYLFEALQNHEIDAVKLESETSFKVYHRSPKKPGCIQLSVGFYKNGELYPTYDSQYETFRDMLKDGYESGIYTTFKNAA